MALAVHFQRNLLAELIPTGMVNTILGKAGAKEAPVSRHQIRLEGGEMGGPARVGRAEAKARERNLRRARGQ